MGKDAEEAVLIRPPRRGECYRFAGTASMQVFAVPAAWKGLKVRFEAVNDTFEVQTAPDVSISIDAATTFSAIDGSNNATTSNAIGDTIGAGQYKEFDFTSADAFVGFRGTGTAGQLRVRAAETALGGRGDA